MQVTVDDVSKRFGAFAALANVSFQLQEGQLVALVGANGAGKTTLLECLAGLLGPSTGSILLDGERLDRERLDLRRRFGMLADTPPLVPNMTPIEHIAMVLRLYERPLEPARDRVVEWLREMRLLAAADSEIGSLSRGERYKVALIGLMACDPELWILDEPLASGMDPSGLEVLKRELHAAAERGRTILYTTQLLEIAEHLSNRILILSHGRLLADGTLAELRRRSQSGDSSLADVFAELHAL